MKQKHHFNVVESQDLLLRIFQCAQRLACGEIDGRHGTIDMRNLLDLYWQHLCSIIKVEWRHKLNDFSCPAVGLPVQLSNHKGSSMRQACRRLRVRNPQILFCSVSWMRTMPPQPGSAWKSSSLLTRNR